MRCGNDTHVGSNSYVRTGHRGARVRLGVQAALWGRPFPEYLHSIYEGVKAGAAHLNYLHKFSALKTAADRYVNTPNNVSIDAYGNAEVGTEPVVISVAALREPRCTSSRSATCSTKSSTTSAAPEAQSQASSV